jgi:hypothetical protein
VVRSKYFSCASGSFDDPIAIAANYPTFVCSRTTYGSIADMGNPCIRVLAKALGGLSGVFLFDFNPHRFRRRAAKEQPWNLLHPKLVELFRWYCDESMLRSKARVLILNGAQQLQRYRQLRPKAQPFGLEGQPVMYAGTTHGFLERGANGEPERIVMLIYHMECWLRGMSAPAISHIEQMLSAALTFAYPATPVTVTLGRKPIRPYQRAAESFTLLPQRATGLPSRFAPPSLTITEGSNVIAVRNGKYYEVRYPLLCAAVRALYVEQQTGIALTYDNLVEELKPFYHPPVMDLDHGLPYGNSMRTRLIRGLFGCDDPVGFDIERAYEVLDASTIAHALDDSNAFYASNLWPMLARVFRQTEATNPPGTNPRGFFTNAVIGLVDQTKSQLTWSSCMVAVALVSRDVTARSSAVVPDATVPRYNNGKTYRVLRVPDATVPRYNNGKIYRGTSDAEYLAKVAVKYLNAYVNTSTKENALRLSYRDDISRFSKRTNWVFVSHMETLPAKIARLTTERDMVFGPRPDKAAWVRLQKSRLVGFPELMGKVDQRFR